MGNAVVHFEVGAADDGPLAEFYGELFGWDLRGFPGGGYTMIDTRGGSGINGGIARSQAGQPWSAFYVETDDLAATLERANSLGGTTVTPATDYGASAAVAMFRDPDGLLVGLVQAPAGCTVADGAAPAWAAPSAGQGEPVEWFEVFGSDAARTRAFYAGVFGWAVDDAPDYAVADPGAGHGIQGGLGGGAPSRWATVYARVADVDQTLARVEKLGGSRVTDPVPFALKDAARVALYGAPDDDTMKTSAFRDPAGNVFGIYHR